MIVALFKIFDNFNYIVYNIFFLAVNNYYSKDSSVTIFYKGTHTVPQLWILGGERLKRIWKRKKLGGKHRNIKSPLKQIILVKANDQASLTSQAVNVEQTVPGKPSPNDRPSYGKNKGALTRTPLIAAWLCFMKAGNKRKRMSGFKCLFLMQTGSVSHSAFFFSRLFALLGFPPTFWLRATCPNHVLRVTLHLFLQMKLQKSTPAL